MCKFPIVDQGFLPQDTKNWNTAQIWVPHVKIYFGHLIFCFSYYALKFQMRISKWLEFWILILRFHLFTIKNPMSLVKTSGSQAARTAWKEIWGTTKANEATLTRAFLRSFHTYLVKFYFGDLKMCTLSRDWKLSTIQATRTGREYFKYQKTNKAVH